jgi:transposase-like protein
MSGRAVGTSVAGGRICIYLPFQELTGIYPVNTSKATRSISLSKVDRKPKQNIAGDLSYTVGDFNREFPNDDACLEYIKEQRWPNGVTECKKCNIERKYYRVAGRTAYACDHCGNHIYPLAGTIFAKSATSLKTWFYVIYLMVSTGCAISAKQIQRETRVTYKTAWRALRQIRAVLGNEDLQPEHPTVEMDEIRHEDPCKIDSRQDNKVPVVRRIERNASGRFGRDFDA